MDKIIKPTPVDIWARDLWGNYIYQDGPSRIKRLEELTKTETSPPSSLEKACMQWKCSVMVFNGDPKWIK